MASMQTTKPMMYWRPRSSNSLVKYVAMKSTGAMRILMNTPSPPWMPTSRVPARTPIPRAITGLRSSTARAMAMSGGMRDEREGGFQLVLASPEKCCSLVRSPTQ